MSDPGPVTDEPKTKQVIDRIRASIVRGHYSPGLRLPTFVEMEGDFAVGRAVLQHAVATLKRDGFIRSEGRRGLYVTENPPHLFQYGLVMPSSPGDAGWCQLMTALSNEAHRIENSDSQRRFRFYYGVSGANGASDKTLQELLDDVENHRLAGLIVHHDSAARVAEMLGETERLPRMYLWADETSAFQPCLTTDGVELLERCLTWMKQKGCQRIAVVQMEGTNVDVDHGHMFEAAGLAYHAPWIQWVSRSDPAAAERMVTLLMDYRRESRPDGLIVTDDNLVLYASRGLVSSGIRVGEDLQLVAHCNWPWPPRSVLPMARIGFDVRALLRRAMDGITHQQKSQGIEMYQRVPAQFDWEVEGN